MATLFPLLHNIIQNSLPTPYYQTPTPPPPPNSNTMPIVTINTVNVFCTVDLIKAFIFIILCTTASHL